MKLNARAMASTGGLLWGGAVLAAGVANLAKPKYANDFLKVIASIYPGYRARPKLDQVAVGTLYAVVDGAIGGALCAWLYNQMNDSR
jgi:hypothetical protein